MFYVSMNRPSQTMAHSIDRLLAATADQDTDAPRSPALDLSETETAFTATLNLPGVRKEDVRVAVEGRRVSIQAQAQTEPANNEGERLVHRERAAARYARQFSLPLEVDAAHVHAVLEHGVLSLTLPKRMAATASQITVK
jgi:HSP20 family protein